LPHSPADIRAAFTAAGRAADPETADHLAREIKAYGGLDRAIAALANDEAQTLLSHLLAYRAALAEAVDPARRLARLKREASDLEARAEPLWAEAAAFAGRAAFRRLQGEPDLAELFQRKVDAAETLAADLEAQAFAKRLEAAVLDASRRVCQDLAAALQAIAA